jgi:hypothetical protein
MATQYANGKIVTDGLVLCLNAADKNSYPGSGTTWTDVANTNNGTLTNGPTFDSTSNSIAFDGINNYASLSFTGVSNLSAFSVSFWAKTTNVLLNSTVYSEGTPASWPSNLFIIYFGDSGNSGKCRVWFGYPTVSSPLIGTTVVTDGKWYYVTYNQTSTSNRTLSINGVVEATDTTTFTSTTTNTYIGANNNNGSMVQFGKSNVAQILCYNRALSQSEIIQNYNAQKSRFNL